MFLDISEFRVVFIDAQRFFSEKQLSFTLYVGIFSNLFVKW